MYRLFQRSGIVGILLLCLGCAILGTVVADVFIGEHYIMRRNPTNPQMADFQPALHGMNADFLGAMSSYHFAAMSIQTGAPSVMHPSILKTKKMPVGSLAPDFSLTDAVDQRRVRLADFRGKKPVVLLFGSFGCNIFCGQLERLNKLHHSYKNRVEFLFVYINEAPHKNLLPPPTDAEKNLGRIPRGLRHFKVAFSCLLGNQEIESLYAPYPLRLVIVDRGGRIALDAGLGIPDGWDLGRIESFLKEI